MRKRILFVFVHLLVFVLSPPDCGTGYISPRKLTRKGDQDLGARKPRRELMEASRMLWGCHSGTWRRLRAPLVPADASRKQMLWGPRQGSHEASLMAVLSAGPSCPASPPSHTHLCLYLRQEELHLSSQRKAHVSSSAHVRPPPPSAVPSSHGR